MLNINIYYRFIKDSYKYINDLQNEYTYCKID